MENKYGAASSVKQSEPKESNPKMEVKPNGSVGAEGATWVLVTTAEFRAAAAFALLTSEV